MDLDRLAGAIAAKGETKVMTAALAHDKLRALQRNCERVIKGKSDVIRRVTIGILANGHILIEDVPGVGKTTLARLLARSIDCAFQHIQFTSDLLPSDILGVSIYDKDKKVFEFKRGPIFANIVLADEINRTSPKTQSALLEAMNTAQVSIDGTTHSLPRPFMVIATQNPIEFHGTFPLPRAQLDRFLLRVRMGYPAREDELTILREQIEIGAIDHIKPVLTGGDILAMQGEVRKVTVDDDLISYIQAIAQATRQSPSIELGVSTRAALSLRACAQACAYFLGRDYCTPDDVKEVAVSVLAHRIQVARAFESESLADRHEDEEVLERIIANVPVPL